MIAVILLAAALILAAAGIPLRAHKVADSATGDRGVLLIDQVMSAILALLFAVSAIVAAAGSPLTGAWGGAAQVIAVLAAAVTGGYLVRVVLAAGGIPTRTDNFDDDPANEPLLRGGRVIGVLERTAISASLVLGWPAGIAVVLGIKGLARFPQLREHHASEQFILGTFASVMWACGAAGIAVLLR